MTFIRFYLNFKRTKINLIILLLIGVSAFNLHAQRGYYDAPYKRYEADLGILSNGAVATPKSYIQSNLQSEASDQKCVGMTSANATIDWTLSETADGLVIRYSVPDGQTATIGVYNGNILITTLTLTSIWSWESLWNNGNPNNVGVVNQNPKNAFR
jgi:hypothetical protein